MRALVIAAIALFAGFAQAEEIQLPEYPRYAVTNFDMNQPVTFNSLADVPHDFAKNFKPELYYWWAKMHNAREYDELPEPTRRTLRITTRGTLSASTTGVGRFDWSAGGRRTTSRSQATTEHRTYIQEFREQTGRGPATIYNPYFR